MALSGNCSDRRAQSLLWPRAYETDKSIRRTRADVIRARKLDSFHAEAGYTHASVAVPQSLINALTFRAGP
jgi:hypothetical protein